MPADRDRPDEDLDAAFAAIIAGWDDIPSLDDLTLEQDEEHPTGEPPRRRAGDTPRPAEPADNVPEASSPLPGGEASTGPRDWSAGDDPDDDRYHPPDPPPLPRGDLVGRLAWAGVLLGPLFLLFAGLFWRTAPRVWLAVAVLGFVGGFVTLVLRLPADRDEDGDNGAVV